MGDVRKTGANLFRVLDMASRRLEALPRVFALAPEIIGGPERADQQAIEHRIVGDGILAAVPQQPDDAFDRIEAFRKKKKSVVRVVMDSVEGLVQHWQKVRQPITGIADDLLQVQEQVVHRIGVHAIVYIRGDDFAEDSHHGFGRFHTPRVGLEQVEIVQCVASGLTHDKLPVAIGMAQFPQEGIYALHQPVIAGHDHLDAFIPGVDGYVHIGAGQVGFQRFGLDHCHLCVRSPQGSGCLFSPKLSNGCIYFKPGGWMRSF